VQEAFSLAHLAFLARKQPQKVTWAGSCCSPGFFTAEPSVQRFQLPIVSCVCLRINCIVAPASFHRPCHPQRRRSTIAFRNIDEACVRVGTCPTLPPSCPCRKPRPPIPIDALWVASSAHCPLPRVDQAAACLLGPLPGNFVHLSYPPRPSSIHTSTLLPALHQSLGDSPSLLISALYHRVAMAFTCT
jgi:hypothetical protein